MFLFLRTVGKWTSSAAGFGSSRDYLVLQWWQMKLLQVLEPSSLETIKWMTAPSIWLVTSSSRQLITRQGLPSRMQSFLILFWRTNCATSVLGLFFIKNSKIETQYKRIIIIPQQSDPHIRHKNMKKGKSKEVTCLKQSVISGHIWT